MADALFEVLGRSGKTVVIRLSAGPDHENRRYLGQITLKHEEWAALKELLTWPEPPLELLSVTIREKP